MRIAIVGAGVSGLVAAHLLHRRARDRRLRGERLRRRAHEHDPRRHGARDPSRRHRLHRDERPQLPELHAPARPTRCGTPTDAHELLREGRGARTSSTAARPRGLICQPANLASLRFQRMIVDLLRFNRELRALLDGGCEGARSEESMQDFLARHRFSRAFVERLIVPQALRRVVGRPAQLPALSRCASSPSSSPTTACSVFATALNGRPSPAARPATSRRSRRPFATASA